MEARQQAALSLVNAAVAVLCQFVPLSYDNGVLRIAAAELRLPKDELCRCLGVTRIDVEVWSAERVAAGLAEFYPAPPFLPMIPAPRFPAAHRAFEFLLCVGSVAVGQLVAVMVRGRRPLAAVEGYHCPCGHRMEVGFHPYGRVFTVHCASFRHVFAHFECERPPAWWRKRVHFDWMGD